MDFFLMFLRISSVQDGERADDDNITVVASSSLNEVANMMLCRQTGVDLPVLGELTAVRM